MLSLGSHGVSGFSLSFHDVLVVFSQGFHGVSCSPFIRNNTLPLQTLLSLHSYYGCNCIFVFDWCGSCHEGME